MLYLTFNINENRINIMLTWFTYYNACKSVTNSLTSALSSDCCCVNFTIVLSLLPKIHTLIPSNIFLCKLFGWIIFGH